MRRHVTAYRLTVASAVLFLALVVALNGLGTFNTDIKPEVYLAPWAMAGRYLSAWTESPYLGSPNFNVGLVPVLLVIAALRGIGLSPEWAYKVFHFAIWLAAAWGCVRLSRRLLPEASKWVGLTVAVIYLANPYSIQAGTTLAIALPYALLPWLLLCFVRAVRQTKGWGWSAAFGLVFFGMSGMNVAVVPILQLLALIPLVIFARLDWGVSWRRILVVLGQCALFVVGLSLYWLLPGAGALNTGTQIVSASETLTGIAKVSSFPEVLRGMGLWPLYGTDSNGPWVPQDSVYLTSAPVLMLTMLWPVCGLIALRWCRGVVRGFVALSVAIAAVFMVGLFPRQGSPASPFGYLLVKFFSLPGMSAFRTTNKAGAVLALAFALALGVGVVHVARMVRKREGLGPLAGAVAVLVVAAWILPALTGRLYTSAMNIPGYWKKAAAAVDKGDPNASVLFLPGQTRPEYRWTQQRPDDVANSLLTRTAIIPETSPNASPPGGNFLNSMDDTLQSGIAPSSAMSTYARYLGADQIMLRHDTVWETDGGARPATTDREISGDPGLFGAGNFGAPGEFVFAPRSNPYAYGEALLSPLQVYNVRDSRQALRAESLSNAIVVAGDGWSVPAMSASGLLSNTPTFQYAQDLSTDQLSAMLGGGHQLVLTDTNARRSSIPNRLTNGEGALLSIDQNGQGMRTLGTNTDDQTVLVRSGAIVSATSQGGAFFDLPYAVPENALDGDPSTSWLFGDFDRAAGQQLTINEPTPIALGTIQIAQAQVGATKIDEVTVRAGGKAVTAKLPDTGYASFDMGNQPVSQVTVTIDSQRGSGYNLVGISDIKMPGPLAIRTARTPVTFSNAYESMDAAQRAAFDKTPLDVLLTRVQNTAAAADDAETGLRRIVTLPDTRTFQSSAMVRVQGSLEHAYDKVAGYSDSQQATSSDFYFKQAQNRASQAADGSATTAWVPGDTMKGAWWQLRGAARAIPSVSINQLRAYSDTSGDRTLWAQQVAIAVDGKQVATAQLKHDGTTTIALPPGTRGSTVRMTVLDSSGRPNFAPARFTEINTGVTMQKTTPGPLDEAGSSGSRCLAVATIDGQPVRMRPATGVLAGAGDQGTRWVGCATSTLKPGERRVEQAPGYTLDSVSLKDVQSRQQAAPTPPSTTITKNSITSKQLKVTSSGRSAILISQSYDSRWWATANGRSLGAPQVIDGYSVGWILPAAGTYTIDIGYGPQTKANLAIGLSLLVMLGAIALLVFARVKRRLAVFDPIVPSEDRDALDLVPAAAARPVAEVALVVLAGFFVGWAGLAAALAVVALLRWRPIRSVWLLITGAALVLVSSVVYLIAIGDLRGTVSADAVAVSLWPHYLAGAGLVIALAGALRERFLEADFDTAEPSDSTPGVADEPLQPHPEFATAGVGGRADQEQRSDDRSMSGIGSRAKLFANRTHRCRQPQH